MVRNHFGIMTLTHESTAPPLPAPLILTWTIGRSGSGNRNSEVNIWGEDNKIIVIN